MVQHLGQLSVFRYINLSGVIFVLIHTRYCVHINVNSIITHKALFYVNLPYLLSID